MDKGARIGAILSMNKDQAEFLGYGIFEGYEACEELDGIASPKLSLDNGNVVWGYQCWWGSEAKIKSIIGGKNIVQATLAAA